MRTRHATLLGLAVLLGTVTHGRAASTAPPAPGPARPQTCSAPVIHAVGAFLKLDAFELPAPIRGPDADAVIASAACRISPADRTTTIAAIAYRSSNDDAKALVVTRVDTATGRVVGSHQGEIGEDAGMRVVADSVMIDTAPYVLAKGVRAFGVDVTSGYIANCGDGGAGATRTLYVQEGATLRPVLEMTMSYWHFLQQGRSRCTTMDAPEATIVEQFDLSIALASTSTNGFRDLQITATSTRDDSGRPTRKPFHMTLKYDGRAYDSHAVEAGFWKWRSRP